tara:strand:+ start:4284 stop:4892 length:609 start_codon:yes stop_codon:yes gene_type:complete
MSNRWNAFEEEDQVEIPKTTSNPLRKIKKKIRKKQEKYDKSPSPELYNELLKLKKQLNIFTNEPVKKVKKKKFKKKRIDKAEVAKEKKRKLEKERKERFNAQYNRWKQEQQRKNEEEFKHNRKKIPNFRAQDNLFNLLNSLNYLPLDIQEWMNNPTKKGYYVLMKTYHPDKNDNKDNDYAKFITSYWSNYTESTYTKVHKSP